METFLAIIIGLVIAAAFGKLILFFLGALFGIAKVLFILGLAAAGLKIAQEWEDDLRPPTR